MGIDLWILNESKAYQPPVVGGITWETSRKGEPGVLKFTCLQDDILDITEGNPVKLQKDGKNVFFGFIFGMCRSKDKKIQVTAYDQLRYFKNKDSYIYKNKRADQLIEMIAGDFGLRVGKLANTGYVIPARCEDNKTLFDISQNALDETLKNTTRLYVLYDDFGALSLEDTENMLLDLLIDEETGENFTYSSSINDQTYNQVKLIYDNEETARREVYISRDSSNINKWGVLQFFEKLDNPQGASAKADALLKLYNAKTRNLKITKAFGDVRVRAGCSVVVFLNLGDIKDENYMLVENVKHTFEKDSHFMDLTLRGGEFIA